MTKSEYQNVYDTLVNCLGSLGKIVDDYDDDKIKLEINQRPISLTIEDMANKESETGNETITKQDAFDMMLNALYQIRDMVADRAPIEDIVNITINPDMDNYDDFSLDNIIEIAEKYSTHN